MATEHPPLHACPGMGHEKASSLPSPPIQGTAQTEASLSLRVDNTAQSPANCSMASSTQQSLAHCWLAFLSQLYLCVCSTQLCRCYLEVLEKCILHTICFRRLSLILVSNSTPPGPSNNCPLLQRGMVISELQPPAHNLPCSGH